jgi:CheY-like chemotaxis protein/tetratricopeptide (TPR) repeat protein
MNRRPKILIVDDEPFNVAVLEQELNDLDYDTISAADGQEALAQVAAASPDLVLLDIMMPIMDGFEVLARLKADPTTRDIPIIVISANNDMPSVVKGIKRGAEDYLPKPFDPVLLQARISACLEKKQLRDQEVEYLRQVERLTQAAAAVEANTFDYDSLTSLAVRPDALGGLARVFQRMAREVHAREQRLRQQLEQLRLDIEERQKAARETVATYIPMDRRHALARGVALPERTRGAALFADISGFTPLTEALAQELGLQRGAEELTRQLNRVYSALIDAVHHYGGSVIGFSGDAITCWFDENDERGTMNDETQLGDTCSSFIAHRSSLRAVACALAMQAAVEQFTTITTPAGTTIALAIKVVVVAGRVRRFLVGDPEVQLIEVQAGQMLDELARGEHLAQRGEVLVQAPIVESLGSHLTVVGWRSTSAPRQQFALVNGLTNPVPAAPWPDLPPDGIAQAQIKSWLLPPVYERVNGGKSEFLSELRPVAALFLMFEGLDYDEDAEAGTKLDAFVRWVQAVLQRYGGALLQLTMGDKGSYLYAAFGAPIAHEDDPARAVSAALELRSPPAELPFIMNIRIGVTYGQMRAGAYGSATRRTYGVLGDKTNLAARLMQIASDILCDEAIYRATQAMVAFEVLSPIMIKGKAQPVPIYRPLSKTPQRIIGSRIDQLPLAHQLTLKVASVIGQDFTISLLRDIYPSEADKPLLEEHLQTLAQLDLVARHPSEPHTEGPYAFNDPLTQETSYSRLLFAQRRQLHRAVAEWYERTYADDLAPYYPLLAQHWGKAEDMAKAIEYLERAGEQAQQRGDYQEAFRYFNESLALNAQAAVLSTAYYAADDLDPPSPLQEGRSPDPS